MRTSEQTNEIAAALSKAQAEFPNIPKNRTAKIHSPKGNYEYHYADLSDILTAIRPAFTKNGLSLVQGVENDQGSAQIVTRVSHGSGQFYETTFKFHEGARMQETGSSITYLRRYCLSGIIGIASEEDDDGNHSGKDLDRIPRTNPTPTKPQIAPGPAASSVAAQGSHPQPKSNPGGEWKPSDAQIKRLYAIASSAGWSQEEIRRYAKQQFNVDSGALLTRDQYDQMCNVDLPKGPYEFLGDQPDLDAEPGVGG